MQNFQLFSDLWKRLQKNSHYKNRLQRKKMKEVCHFFQLFAVCINYVFSYVLLCNSFYGVEISTNFAVFKIQIDFFADDNLYGHARAVLPALGRVIWRGVDRNSVTI